MGVFVVFLVLPPWAHALEVGLARLQDGEVRVLGKGAAKDASIYWQGVAVTTSTGGGSFNFTTSNIPVTCVGKLSDGVTTLYIAVSGCSASGVTIPSTVAPVAATGQTTIYAIGDDGFHQKGVPQPNPRFTDNLDGTVTDNLTGLIWLKDAGCPGKTLWFGALAAVDRLQDGVCGLTDGSVAGAWRLPNRNELLSLLYKGSGLETGTGHPFIAPEDPSDYYWSSTTYPNITVQAWTVRIFEDGFEDRGHKGEDLNLVIGVRGGF
jgi:hypothetical protein